MQSKQLTQSCLHANCQSLNFYVHPFAKTMGGGGRGGGGGVQMTPYALG